MDWTDEVSRLAKSGESMTCMTMAGTPAEHGDPLPLDELEGPFGVEVVHHHELAAGGRVGDQQRMAARGVEERHRQQVGVLDAR